MHRDDVNHSSAHQCFGSVEQTGLSKALSTSAFTLGVKRLPVAAGSRCTQPVQQSSKGAGCDCRQPLRNPQTKLHAHIFRPNPKSSSAHGYNHKQQQCIFVMLPSCPDSKQYECMQYASTLPTNSLYQPTACTAAGYAANAFHVALGQFVEYPGCGGCDMAVICDNRSTVLYACAVIIAPDYPCVA